MIIDFKSRQVKSNDNMTEKPQITGDYAKDSVILKDKWRLTDTEFAAWLNVQHTFVSAIDGAIRTVIHVVGPVLRNKHALFTAALVSLITLFFTMINRMPKDERMFILEIMDKQLSELEKKRD